MQILRDYNNYQEHLGECEEWKYNVKQTNAKRQEYIKKHNLKINREDAARAKALINAIDVMDEYSQSESESMENAAQAAKVYISQIGSYIGMAAGLLAGLPAAKKTKMASLLLVPAGSILGSIAGMIYGISWAAEKQVGASRKGRFKAMKEDLSNPAAFAVLTPEQEKQAREIAKTIPIDKKMKKSVKGLMGKNSEFVSGFKQFINLFKSDDAEYKMQQAEFADNIRKNEKRFNEPLSKQDIENAKKDRQMFANIVEKIDYASQKYAERAELATNTISAAAAAGGLALGMAVKKLVSAFKSKNLFLNYGVPFLTGAGLAVSLSVLAAKLQKQASRAGRFKVKQEFLNNPDQLVYIDEKDLPKEDVKIPEKKQENIFQFVFRLMKENKEYKNHIKKDGIKQKQYQKALEKIKLSPEQLKDAKTLQMNTFKTFNKVDEKSQQYAESVEAAGELLNYPVSSLFGLIGAGLGAFFARKDFKAVFDKANQAKTNQEAAVLMKSLAKPIGKFILGFLPALIPSIAIDVIFTRKQLEASRTADMLALKELSDYRHYVDYDNLKGGKQDAVQKQTLPPKAGSNLVDFYKNKSKSAAK